jgi:hypothetical protein
MARDSNDQNFPHRTLPLPFADSDSTLDIEHSSDTPNAKSLILSPASAGEDVPANGTDFFPASPLAEARLEDADEEDATVEPEIVDRENGESDDPRAALRNAECLRADDVQDLARVTASDPDLVTDAPQEDLDEDDLFPDEDTEPTESKEELTRSLKVDAVRDMRASCKPTANPLAKFDEKVLQKAEGGGLKAAAPGEIEDFFQQGAENRHSYYALADLPSGGLIPIDEAHAEAWVAQMAKQPRQWNEELSKLTPNFDPESMAAAFKKMYKKSGSMTPKGALYRHFQRPDAKAEDKHFQIRTEIFYGLVCVGVMLMAVVALLLS